LAAKASANFTDMTAKASHRKALLNSLWLLGFSEEAGQQKVHFISQQASNQRFRPVRMESRSCSCLSACLCLLPYLKFVLVAVAVCVVSWSVLCSMFF
jgi:hypothetical protein